MIIIGVQYALYNLNWMCHIVSSLFPYIHHIAMYHDDDIHNIVYALNVAWWLFEPQRRLTESATWLGVFSISNILLLAV